MANEVTKAGSSSLSLDFGSVDISDLTPAQQEEIKALVAKQKVDIAIDAAKRRIKSDSSRADMDQVIGTAIALDQTHAGFSIKSEHETASGKTSISVRKVKLFG